MLNLILLYLIYLFHLIILLLMMGGPIYSKDTTLLLLIILINSVIITGWYVHGYCVLTDIENSLKDQNDPTKNDTKSFVTAGLQKYFPAINDNIVDKLFGVVPFVSTLICCYTIYNKNLIR